jgi:protein gp37
MMAEQTGISWCHSTWSPWRSCVKVSPGCDNCYAEAMSRRNPAVLGEWGKDGKRVVNADWRKPLAWDRAAKKAGERRRVFPSLCDPFEEFSGRVVMPNGKPCVRGVFQECLTEAAYVEPWGLDDLRWEFLDIIRRTRNLDWLVLTKRPENIAAKMADYREVWDGLVLPNLWLGTSVEDQQRADDRIPHLLATPAAIRWLSVEPLLGPIDLTRITYRGERINCLDSIHNPAGPGISWVVIGGESGPNARPCDLAWIRDIVAQCLAAGVPVFVKQDSGPKPGTQGRIPDDVWSIKEFPDASRS